MHLSVGSTHISVGSVLYLGLIVYGKVPYAIRACSTAVHAAVHVLYLGLYSAEEDVGDGKADLLPRQQVGENRSGIIPPVSEDRPGSKDPTDI
jgi:hypothetical protein